MSTTFTFLGTGTSVGVPVIGCSCPVCTSSNPKNTRTRSSLLIQSSIGDILIDSGPDLREQALREGFSKIEHVLYTHDHVDHVVGFDELRAFCWQRDEPLPLHGSPHTLATLARMFPWAFLNEARNYVRPDARPFLDYAPLRINNLTVIPLPIIHAQSPTHGFLFQLRGGQSIAYLPDVKSIPPDSLSYLTNLDLLIIDALRIEPHPTHMSLSEALATAQLLQPQRTLFTHLTHDLDHETTNNELPESVSLAYDGLRLIFPSS